MDHVEPEITIKEIEMFHLDNKIDQVILERVKADNEL